ncbi:GTP cyclohydrolase II [Treponema sp. J25]|uniref:GTP cyclohydrolase II n=1 Tax=Treponema sp. J25 TaxID=2094121 RepID=UPI00104F12A1|nr:GTP cyclohydrolase II [Treponema sp. J25]TCW60878.1 bifunctional 3,4-dihydroxy-2-butanone-4-phosphate synthase/GTP cyclohydrolase II [Treponema sp. J25]
MKNIEKALAAIRKGEMLIIVDDEHRENEADLCIDARYASPTHINFMIRQGGGLICVPLTPERARELSLAPMVAWNEDPHRTAFTVSVDAQETKTGISAFERATTIRRLVDKEARGDAFRRPGHVFPLIGRPGGVLERPGHTEAALDMVRLAREQKDRPAGATSIEREIPLGAAICEILAPDGTMLKGDALTDFAIRHGLCILSIEELIQYRQEQERHLIPLAETVLPTKYGDFRLFGFLEQPGNREHLALLYGTGPFQEPVLCRIHSACCTGDALGSLRCDCGSQLQQAMARITEKGSGIILYLDQEGRGIGLINKIRAYALQDRGLDTVEANVALGFRGDERDYGAAVHMLRYFGIHRVDLLTNNPHKVGALEAGGIEVVGQVPLLGTRTALNDRYIQTKIHKMGHRIPL